MAEIVSIEVQVTNDGEIEVGAETSATVIATKDDTSTVDVTLGCILSVDDVSVADVDDKGKITVRNQGQCRIKAAYGSMQSEKECKSNRPFDPEAAPVEDPKKFAINKRLNYFSTGMQFLDADLETEQVLSRFVNVKNWELAADCPGSEVNCDDAGLDATTLYLYKNGIEFGTIEFEADESEGEFATDAVVFAPGDVLTIGTSPDSEDLGGHKNLSVTFIGDLVSGGC